ncbi:hypothetical protein TNCV_1619651 [Trichonephila clavipes]|nr:hypothetical protein TNCV_1619651 [Trichonephila clavipes]
MSDIGPFPGYFLTISSTTLAPDQLALYNPDDRLNLLSSENSTHALVLFSPIVMLTTPLQTGSTVLSGQWDTHNRRRTSNTTSPCRLLHIPVVLNDFHSRENNAVERCRTPWQHLLFFALLRSFQ